MSANTNAGEILLQPAPGAISTHLFTFYAGGFEKCNFKTKSA